MFSQDLKESFDKFKGWALGVAGFFGAISDICTPLAPFSKYLFISSLILLAIFCIAYFILQNQKLKIMPIIIFVAISAFINGIMFGLQGSDNKGFLADNIPAIENLQGTLGIIQKDIKSIKDDTVAIRQDTSDIRKNTESINQKMDKIADNFGKQGGIISNPTIPEEFYHNARIYEINGDYGNARKSYVKYFGFDEYKLDPHLRFQSFLKIQEGLAGAKEIYNEMFQNSDNIVNKFAIILLQDNKKLLLEEFAKNNQNFGPVYYELARLYSQALLGNQTLEDIRAEKEYIEKFLNAYENGNLTKYFIDKEELDNWIKYAQERKIAISKTKNHALENQASMLRVFIIDKWQISLIPKESVIEIFYRIDGNGEFKSTGFQNIIDRKTGKPFPNYDFSVPENKAPKMYVEFQYKDINGKIQGPFKFDWINETANDKAIAP